MANESRTLTARFIFPADAPPLPGGTITIEGDKVVAVEPAGTRTADEDLGNVAILPGLVNAHTHLDLSDARGKIPPGPDFTGWLRRVIAHRRSQTMAPIDAAIRAGIDESVAHGVTLMGDISATSDNCAIAKSNSVRVRIFWEALGLTLSRSRQVWQTLVEGCLSGSPAYDSTETIRFGLSPHAPYSVADWLFRKIARRARHENFPVAIHLAETSSELELLRTHGGPFQEFLCDQSAWDPTRLVKSVGSILDIYCGVASILLIHCNYLDVSLRLPPNATIVYCPRTHAAFGHPPHPFREFMKRGVRVVLGTDSLASNPDLDILAEARFVHARHPDVPGETLLRMITLDGAIALGWGDVTGSLTPGKSADLVVLPLPDRDERDPHRLVFDSVASVQRVMFRGQWPHVV